MKLNNRILLALLFIFMFATEKCVSVVRKHYSVMRIRKDDSKNSKQEKNKKILTLAVSNPMFTLVVGFIEAIGGNKASWIKCLPNEWKKDIKDDNKKTSPMEDKFGKWSEALQNISKAIENVINVVCIVKEALVTVIKQILGNEGKKPSLFIEGKFQRLFRNKYGVLSWIQNKSSNAWTSVKGVIDSAWNLLSDKVKHFVDKTKEDLIKFKKYFIDFFHGSTFQTLKNVAMCINKSGKFPKEKFNTVKTGFEKFQNINKEAKPGKTTIYLVITDIIVGLFCNWKDFKNSIDYFLIGFHKIFKVEKFYWYGKAVGGLVMAVSGATAIQQKLTSKLKLKRRYRRRLMKYR